MNEKISDKKNESLKGLYALIANTTSQPSSCPTDENIAAFIDHQLKGQDRQLILQHLNQCPSCYREWMLTCETIETPSRQKQASIWQNIWQKITGFQPVWLIGLPTAAASVIIVMLAIGSFANNINNQIDDIYSRNIANSDRYTIALKTLPLPWKKTYLGFDQPVLSLANRAYGAGLWKGRADLLKTDDQTLLEKPLAFKNMSWSTNEWSDYYHFGRWSVIFWAILKSGQKIESWQDYKSIQASLLANFSKHSTKDVDAQEALSSLYDLDKLLITVEQNQTRINRLVRGLENTMHRLGPDHL